MDCFWSDKNVANIANLFMVNKKELEWTEKKKWKLHLKLQEEMIQEIYQLEFLFCVTLWLIFN